MRLAGAHIRRLVCLDQAHLSKPAGDALNAEGISARDIHCQDGFTAAGTVSLRGAELSGTCTLDGASLGSNIDIALDLRDARIRDLRLRPVQPPDGIIDLTNAHVAVFYDNQQTWPAILRLSGFTYDAIGEDPVSVRDRLRWLARNEHGYAPQVYDQLATCYRRAGLEQAAIRVGVAKQWHRRSKLREIHTEPSVRRDHFGGLAGIRTS